MSHHEDTGGAVAVKICGITNREDAEAAIAFGADALGFVFYPNSPRYVSPEDAARIVRDLPPFVTTVGVFVDVPKEEVNRTVARAGLRVAQLHGNEPPEACTGDLTLVKAIRVRQVEDISVLEHYRVSAYLLDTYRPGAPGGTGHTFDWDIAVKAKRYGPVILAGGLTAGSVADAVRHVRPYAVDVSSGVEAEKGRKDHGKLRAFIQNAKTAL